MAGLMDVHRNAKKAQRIFGYDVREPFSGEHAYFRKNPHVAGMAAEDGKITLNPYSTLNPQQRLAVARNEAARLWMRDNKFEPDFDVTPDQIRNLSGSEYVKPGNEMFLRRTILARALSGDNSAGSLTDKQAAWLSALKKGLEKR